MDDPNQAVGKGEQALVEMTRGVFVGVLAVAVIAAWALSFEPIFLDATISPISKLARIMLCDAIPLATLLALYRGIGRNDSTEGIVFGIFRAIFLVRAPEASSTIDPRESL